MLCGSLEGWGWLGGGSKDEGGGNMCVLMADSCLLSGKNQHNVVKQLSSN